MSKIWLQYFIHEASEGGRSITKSKWHNQKLVVAFVCMEGGFRNVLLFHSDLMVARAEV